MVRETEKPGISAAFLKWLAVVTMFIDHACAVYFLTWYFPAHKVTVFTYWLYYILRGVGRLAFPIYCFLLAEGFRRTKSVGKYLLRLGLFGLISEIPFDLAFENTLADWEHQNVFFTLALGLAAIWAWDTITRGDHCRCSFPRLCIAMAAAAAAAGLAHLMRTDYGWVGGAVIMLMHIFRDEPENRFLTAGPALLFAGGIEAVGWPCFRLFDRYNGRRGKQRKYFYYVFYPGHLLLLSLIRALAAAKVP